VVGREKELKGEQRRLRLSSFGKVGNAEQSVHAREHDRTMGMAGWGLKKKWMCTKSEIRKRGKQILYVPGP